MLVRCCCLFFLGGFSFAQRGHGFCRKILALAALGTSFRLAGVMILSHVFSCSDRLMRIAALFFDFGITFMIQANR